MASTTALYTGLAGLTVNSRSLDVIGNNIANANTTAFKSSRMLFATQFYRNLSEGTAPGAFSGGTNPSQVGFGSVVAGTQRNFTNGSLSVTGDSRDLAIDGDGFFIVRRGVTPFYTRAGAFRQNAANDLVTVSGERVQGWGVDANYNIDRSQLRDIRIPTGTLTVAEQSTYASLTGTLNAGGPLPTNGSRTTLSPLFLRAGAAGTLDGTTPLTDVANTSGGPAIFSAGETFRVTGVRKGTQTLAPQTLAITAGTTVDDLMNFLTTALAIQPDAGRNPDGTLPGVTIDGAGVITIDSNAGTVNGLDIEGADLQILDAAGTVRSPAPFIPTLAATSTGESVRTRIVAYDSLGGAVNIDITLALVQRVGGSGTTWRWYAESPENPAGTGLPLGTGTIAFDENGQISQPSSFQVTLDRTGTGATSPMSLTFDFNRAPGNVTAFNGSQNNSPSRIEAAFVDGAPAGTLQGYNVGDDGIITGAFSNGRTRVLGQIPIATFANQEGLVEVGANLFSTGPNSGVPIVSEPQALGAGKIVGGSLELSNTELSQEFINLILASTGFSAASRVITTSDQLIQQLLAIGA